ncbi:MAG: signal transduction histidine kinase, partial [Rhodothermales bacterium]
ALGQPMYGPGFLLYNLACLAAVVVFVRQFRESWRESVGIVRLELQFLLLGFLVFFGWGVCCAVLLPLAGLKQAVQLAPLGVPMMLAIVAWGIARQRIMDVGTFLRGVLAKGFIGGYLVLVYLAVWGFGTYILQRGIPVSDFAVNLLAAVATAFSFAPAHGPLQRVATSLFINLESVDVSETLQKASGVLDSIANVNTLLARFSQVVQDSFGTDSVSIMLGSGAELIPVYSSTGMQALPVNSAVAEKLKRDKTPFSLGQVRRLPSESRLAEVIEELESRRSAMAVGIEAGTEFDGVMLLGDRLSGRVYGQEDVDTLKLLGRQLATALHNARLFTAVESGKAYNETVLQNLQNGVIATDRDGIVTMLNLEARRITELPAENVVGEHYRALPVPLPEYIEQVLEGDKEVRDVEIMYYRNEREGLNLRLGCSRFQHDASGTGAILVLHDLTQLRQLEMQVRYSDRLASVGTLAAGMAHEIKNPLVAISTFSQLLPEQYDDPEFRDSFSEIVNAEVNRIDKLVNDVLKFGQPSKPVFVQVPLHEQLQRLLLLVKLELRKKEISLVSNFAAKSDIVHADPDQIHQATLNLVLNAIDSMEPGGCLRLSTESVACEDGRPGICLQFSDSGPGISEDAVLRIFDPFYTTKAEGTGLGLAITHGIVTEHGGQIAVDSPSEQGTTFRIILPLSDT